MERVKSFVQQRIVVPFMAQLKQGITPEKLALSVAIGLVGGVFPIPGVTSVVCIALAWLLVLNQVVVQVVNLAATPLQLLMMMPFMRAGDWLWAVLGLPAAPSSGMMGFLLGSMARAVLVWLLLGPLLALVAYTISLPLVRQLPLGKTDK